MEYKIEPIGAEFSKKAIGQLEQRFTQFGRSGWRLHSVFQARQPGCLGTGSSTITHFAIYIKE
jgi:hypothetical protein